VRREAVQAVAHHFGVTDQTISKWRRLLGIVGQPTKGTHRLKVEHGKERLDDALPAAWAKADDPERCRKIAEARRGKPRPEHVVEAMRRGRTGKPQSEEARAKMSAAHRARGTRPPKAGRPWTHAEDEAVRTLSPAEAAERTGRTLRAVYSRRAELQLPDGRR
jgi:hypothetical protein